MTSYIKKKAIFFSVVDQLLSLIVKIQTKKEGKTPLETTLFSSELSLL